MIKIKNTQVDFFVSLVLFIATIILCYFVIDTKLPALQSSIEPTVWVQVRFIVENFPNLSWFPNWYLGYPARFSGAPIATYLLAALDKITAIPIPTLDWFLASFFLGLVSVGVYFLANFLTTNKLISFLTAIIFSILPSAGYIFPQATKVGANSNFLPWRIAGFLTFGGGQKLLGFGILPFLMLLLWQSINNFSSRKFVLTIILTTILLLIDFQIFVSFLIFAVAIISAEGFVGEWVEKVKRGVLVILAAVGLSAFWYTPSYLVNILVSPSLAGLSFGIIFQRLFQFALVAIPTFLAVFSFFGKKLDRNEIFVVLSLGFFGFLTILWWATDPDFLTLYSRFFTEIDLVLALTSGLLFSKLIWKFYKSWFHFLPTPKIGPILGSILLVFLIFIGFWTRFSRVNLPRFDIENSVEGAISAWLSDNLSPTDRVYLSGSTAFWLNWTAPNVSQIRGGVDSAATNPFWADASFNLREGEDGETTLAWLKALRTNYLVVHSLKSLEYYHDFKIGEKFAGIGETVFDNGKGDRIYKVETPTLAQIAQKSILKLPRPKGGADFQRLAAYVDVLEKGRNAQANWISTSKIKIAAQNLNFNEGVSVGITYDPGWDSKCKMQSEKCKTIIRKDPVGNLFLEPQISGDFEFILEHHARWDNWIGYFISAFTLLLIAKPKLAKKLFAKLPQLHFGLEEE